ncbi:MAG: F0F1 ATP synthase subunit delta [Cyanobacteria bacterium J069]|nr:MAG: F0F1 ATP synthase subunit delta [Cyanobacteria bacterium J069]
MKDSITASEVSEPYAQALMSLAKSGDLTDRLGEDVTLLRSLLSDSEELQQVLANPLIKPDAKKGILRQILSDQVHPYTLNFLFLLVDRGRILFLDSVCKQYQALLRELKQAVLAEVSAPVELTEEQQEAVRNKVKELTGAQQVDLETRINPELIGGVVIKVGSQVYDTSLRGQLRRIGLKLTGSN